MFPQYFNITTLCESYEHKKLRTKYNILRGIYSTPLKSVPEVHQKPWRALVDIWRVRFKSYSRSPLKVIRRSNLVSNFENFNTCHNKYMIHNIIAALSDANVQITYLRYGISYQHAQQPKSRSKHIKYVYTACGFSIECRTTITDA